MRDRYFAAEVELALRMGEQTRHRGAVRDRPRLSDRLPTDSFIFDTVPNASPRQPSLAAEIVVRLRFPPKLPSALDPVKGWVEQKL